MLYRDDGYVGVCYRDDSYVGVLSALLCRYVVMDQVVCFANRHRLYVEACLKDDGFNCRYCCGTIFSGRVFAGQLCGCVVMG